MKINPYIADGVASPQSIYEVGTTKNHALGTRGVIADRSFRYSKMVDSTAIPAGNLVQMCPPVANHVTETGALTGTTTVGSALITAVLGATAAYVNEYEDGYFKIQSAATGNGQLFHITSAHPAVLSGGTATFVLENPVQVATSGTTTWSLLHNPYGGVVINPTTITAPAAGVVPFTWPAATTAAPNYGWIQTYGIASALVDSTLVSLVAGSGLSPGGNAVGTLEATAETSILQRVGIAMEALATASAWGSVYLQIAP